jgi:putative methyltransferase (TIGR04325 family)
MAFDRLHRLVDACAELPPLRQLRQARYRQRFRGPMGHAFDGVFDSFAAATAALPTTLPRDYDNDAAAAMYVGRHGVEDYDYPALFWLAEALANDARSVCDLGGSVGIKRHAYGPLLGLADDFAWRVVEVPAAARLGRELAACNGPGGLTFGDDLDHLEGDVLLASGSLQYLPRSLGQLLATQPRLPTRMVLNLTPVHATTSYFTHNNIGHACCAYRVYSRAQLLTEAAAAGYRLRAEWQNPGKSLELPFARHLSLHHYSGYCFDRGDA